MFNCISRFQNTRLVFKIVPLFIMGMLKRALFVFYEFIHYVENDKINTYNSFRFLIY